MPKLYFLIISIPLALAITFITSFYIEKENHNTKGKPIIQFENETQLKASLADNIQADSNKKVEELKEEKSKCKIEENKKPERNKIIINEINWSGSKKSQYDEWIELKNISSKAVDLKDWQVLSKSGNINVIFEESIIIEPGKFFVLSHKKSSISSPVQFSGRIRNSGDSIYLFDQNCLLQDFIEAEEKWQYGNNKNKLTIERDNNLNWQTSLQENGTPNAPNSTQTFNSRETKQKIQNKNNKEQIEKEEIKQNRSLQENNENKVSEETIIENKQNHQEKLEENHNEISQNKNQQNENQPQDEKYFEKDYIKELLITEVQIRSNISPYHDYIKIFNPTKISLSLGDLKLVKKSSSGKEYSIKSFKEEDEIESGSYIIWKNNSYNGFYADFETSQTISENNSIALINKTNGEIIDAVCWGEGENQFKEGTCLPNPKSKIIRIQNNGVFQDTNNNANDFTYDAQTNEEQNNQQNETQENEQQTNEEQDNQQNNNEQNQSYNELDIVFSEIAWTGTKASYTDEWIELYNNTEKDINLENWKILGIKNSEIKIEIPLQGIMKSGGYFLLERTDDNTISNITADLIFKGSLNNDGMELKLTDPFGIVIDQLLFEGGWPAGDNSKKLSMERKNLTQKGTESNFQNFNENYIMEFTPLDAEGNKVLGTPKYENSK